MGGSKPKLLSLGRKCCGCGACAARCPHGCIAMKGDACGFAYPDIDLEACIGCSACDAVCPALGDSRNDDGCKIALWAKAKDRELLDASSSGGVFGLLARDILSRGGIVVGAAWDDDCKALRHVAIECERELNSIMRSKYLQSAVGEMIYEQVRNALRSGRPVMFAGTACQVAAVRAYLGRLAQSDSLLLVDVICHGVPSPELWRRWLEYQERIEQAEIHSVNFRSKITGWLSFSVLYEYRTEKDSASRSSANKFADDWYMKAFLKNASLRPSCFSCPAKRACGSDITLGDFWGVQRRHPEVSVEGGVSAVVINTKRGMAAFDRVSGSMSYGESSFQSIVRGNPALVSSVEPASCRDEFVRAIEDGVPILDMMKKWPFDTPLLQRCVGFAKRVAKRLLGRM